MTRAKAEPESTPAGLPPDLASALGASPLVWKRWCAMGYAERDELVARIVKAKRPETRAERIAETIRMVAARTAAVRKALAPHGAARSASRRKSK
jgi:uncharacterized protein YdeI (YjbR/CyaY-like superfamily)